MTEQLLERVRYYRGQYLGADDLTLDQSYHIAMRRRHAIGQHIWGIVEGLNIERQPDGAVFVGAGYAVDGLGRALTVPDRRPLNLSAQALAASPSGYYLIWLEYERTQAGTKQLAPGDSFDRWRESPRIRVVASAARPDGERVTADNGVRAPGPGELPPDDPDIVWPVFLGSLAVDPALQDAFVIDPSGRPYAGLVASELVSPSGGTRIELGGTKPDERFSISLPAGDSAEANGEAADRTVLRIGEDGDTSFTRGVEVGGNTTVAAVGFSAPATEPPQQPGWHIYRWTGDDGDELRIEFTGKGSGGSDTQVPAQPNDGGQGEAAPVDEIAIGVWSQGKFKPGLTIAENGTVTVAGNLIVKGKINPPAEHTAGKLDAAAAEEVAQMRNATAKQALSQQIAGAALKPEPTSTAKLKKLLASLVPMLGTAAKSPLTLVTQLLGIGNPKAAPGAPASSDGDSSGGQA